MAKRDLATDWDSRERFGVWVRQVADQAERVTFSRIERKMLWNMWKAIVETVTRDETESHNGV